MLNLWRRRSFLQLASIALPANLFPFSPTGLGAAAAEKPNAPGDWPVSDLFPTQPPELVREMVTVSHFDLNRVKELTEARPSLAKASWDWGFGDWETALGAASHMGNRAIAEYLISKGAHPSLFSSAMLGHLEVMRAFVAAQPGVERIRGPHSISLLAHARVGGEVSRPVLEFRLSLGDADYDPVTSLAKTDGDAIRGSYSFGPAVNDQIDVTVEKGQAMWTRKGMMGRPLVYLGGRAFYPMGAPAVRIQFSEENPAMLMTIHDPEPALISKRKQEVK